MNKRSNEEEFRRLVSVYQQYQAQIEMIARELGLAQINLEGVERASLAIETMKNSDDLGQDMLVPIGGGSFVHTKLADTNKVVVNIGAGVSVEKTAADAREIMDKRKKDIIEASKKLTDVLHSIENEMAKVQSAIEKLEKAAGSERIV